MTLRGQWIRLSVALPAAIAPVAICVVFHLGGIRVNASSSLPIELYRTTSDLTAKLVEFCPAEPFASLSTNRGYRKKGDCPDGAEPLMKPIAAVADDVVEVSARGLSVNGKLLPNSALRPFNTKSRPLPHWPFGKYRVVPGTVWVISSFNVRSFDSRYFGPVSLCSIHARLTPLLTE